MSNHWFNWILRNVNNPSTYTEEVFKIVYLSQNAIMWEFEDILTYSISSAPLFMSNKEMLLSDYNVRTPADYNITLY